MTDEKPDLTGLAMLLLDDNPASLYGIDRAFEGFGAQVYSLSNTGDALSLLADRRIHVVMASLGLADEKFIEVMRDYKKRHPDSFLYLLTEEEYDTIDASTESVRLVVDDYVRKPVDALRFASMVATSMGRPDTGSTSLAVIEPIVTRIKPYFIFRSEVMRRALTSIADIAASGQTVLISGETGTGKELVARAIHVLSRRSTGPFVPVNCGAIPESLIEGELFGHEKGAFTGAYTTRKGKFESSHRGTLFLDEIGDMQLNLQMRLLRVLEEKKVYRVGAENPVPVDVRVIAATRVDLGKAVKDGLFREDLYYRLNVLRIHLPPLRERIDDIPLLALHFLERAFAEMGRIPPYPQLSPETIYALQAYPWRGNVRELRNVMTRAATLLPVDTKKIFPFLLLPYLEDPAVTVTSDEENKREGVFVPFGTPLDRAEELLIRETLSLTKGNRTKAAKLLGISIRTLRRKINGSKSAVMTYRSE